MNREYWVYIVANHNRHIYTGVTGNLKQRIYQHKQRNRSTFAGRYNMNQLVYYESTNEPYVAITREKQIKGWKRKKKIALIESENPNWADLSEEW